MAQHLESHGVNPRASGFLCYVCRSTHPNRAAILQHLKIHSFTCYVCKASTQTRPEIMQHLKQHSDDPRTWRPHACSWPACHKGFSSNAELQRHLMIHTNEKPFTCPLESLVCYVCKSVYPDRLQMLQHMHCSHSLDPRHVKPYGCAWKNCGKGFPSRAELLRHSLVHTKAKPFECPVCGRRFSLKGNLTKHFIGMHRQHGQPLPPPQSVHDDLASALLVPGLNHVCPLPNCRKAFRNRDCLKKHFMIHTGVKPFKCPQCPYMARQKHHLNHHVNRIHSYHPPSPLQLTSQHVTSQHVGSTTAQTALAQPSHKH
ncbi:hypothetical protein CAPTEDRAFT_189169 [Capitella teleta]|uniref:C2H2-type domain-containing protein n=1 Tax=Capitella teleta TaxID=283909 RepID=R7UP03_CAPTE|nr:hypothetical protein CAPTEDRAFT_189169 [Capitella teleta]|eukprot:ELU08264.1 hypothetical protein CAPTEDRAFT_189169 [Capitella teleta]